MKTLIGYLKENIGCEMQRKEFNGFTGKLEKINDDGEMKISCSDWWESVYDKNPYLPVVARNKTTGELIDAGLALDETKLTTPVK